jgi:HPt (histidine-containing phosphotransfer) domain-containing protein
MAGLPAELASWLAQQLPGVSVLSTRDGRETLDELAKGECVLLIIDHGISSPTAPVVVERARWGLGMPTLPVIYCLDPGLADGTQGEMAQRLGVGRVLVHPIDRTDLVRRATTTLNPLLGPPNTVSPEKQRTRIATMTRIWEQIRQNVMDRLEVLDQAVAALREGDLNEELRESAEREAHKLGGLVGTFGYAEGTRSAKKMERMLEAGLPLGQAEAQWLSDLVAALRSDLEQPLHLETRPQPEATSELP